MCAQRNGRTAQELVRADAVAAWPPIQLLALLISSPASTCDGLSLLLHGPGTQRDARAEPGATVAWLDNESPRPRGQYGHFNEPLLFHALGWHSDRQPALDTLHAG